MKFLVFSLLALLGAGLPLRAQFPPDIPVQPLPSGRVVFSEDFESGNLDKWTLFTGATAFTADNTQNRVPIPGSWSARMDSSKDRMFRHLTPDNQQMKLTGEVWVTFYLYLPNAALSDTNVYGVYGEVRGYRIGSGPNGNGGILQLFAAGVFNTNTMPGETYDPSRYQGRLFTRTAGSTGWFNLNAPGAPLRTPGWHRFDIHRDADGSTVRWYVDGILGRTLLDCDYHPLEMVMIGSTTSADLPQEAFFDGVTVLADNSPPRISIVHGSWTGTEVTVIYSEPVDDTALNAANYSVNGLTVSQAARISSHAIRLTTTAQTAGQEYTLTVNNVKDIASPGNSIAANSSKTFRAWHKAKYSTDFSSQPPDSQTFGTATVHDGRLKLTVNANSQSGAWAAPDLEGGLPITGLTATFKYRIGGGTVPPADGMSFGLGDVTGPFGEDGPGNGLFLAFDNYDNGGGEAPMIELRYGNVVLAAKKYNSLGTGTNFSEVMLQVTPAGSVDVSINHLPVFANVPAYPAPLRGRVAVGGRTGGLNDHHWVDDLVFTTAPTVDQTAPRLLSAAGEKTLTGVAVRFSERVDASGETAANYSLSGGLTVSGVTRLGPAQFLLATSPQSALANYTVTVNNIRDEAGNVIAANSAVTFSANDPAASFFSDFTEPPKGVRMHGNAHVADGVLKLTVNQNNQNGLMVLDDFDQGKFITGFTARFKLRMGGGTIPPADGFSFNFAPSFPFALFPMAEEGEGGGITVSFDNFDNGGGEAPAIEVKVGNTVVARSPFTSLDTGSSLHPVEIVVVNGLLTLRFNGTVIFNNVAVFSGSTRGVFALAARTGGLNAHHWVDDLWIKTDVIPPDLTHPVLLSVLAPLPQERLIHLTFSERMLKAPAESLANYSLVPNLAITSAVLDAEGTRVTLTTQDPLDPAFEYTLTIRNLTDRANTVNDLGPNFIEPNPTVIDFHSVIVGPDDLLERVRGFQDDFTSATRNPLWVPVGSGGDVYQVIGSEGVMNVGTAAGGPNHLLYMGQGYDRHNQEVLARIRVLELSGESARAGVGVGVNAQSEGLNWGFFNVAGSPTMQLQEDAGNMMLGGYGFWQLETYYWVRIRQTPGLTRAKFWPADGVTKEPPTWLDVDQTPLVEGWAGITAGSLGQPARFQVDYILIKAEGLPEITVDPIACRIPVAGCEPLQISRQGTDITVAWTGECILQWSTAAEGPYTDVPGDPASPFLVPQDAPARFFRLRSR